MVKTSIVCYNTITEGRVVEMAEKIKKICLNVLKWITSPIWFPWKVLFVRKPEKKFKVVDRKTQIFRLVRSPITKPLKFIVFLLVMVLEVSIVYKAKNFLGAPLIRSNVHNYYMNELLNEIDETKRDEFASKYETMFEKVDEMSVQAKNNFYAIMDSDAFKVVLSSAKPEVTEYVLDKFNEDEKTRDIIEYNVKNMNTIIPKYIKEFLSDTECAPNNPDLSDSIAVPAGGNCEEITSTPAYATILSLSSRTVDTNMLLDVAGAVMKSEQCAECKDIGSYVTTKDIDDGLLVLEYLYEQR